VSRDDLEHFGGYGDGAAAEAGSGGAGRLCGGEVTVGEDGCSEERTARNGRPGDGICILQQRIQDLLEGEQ
jgi:hypothetical protein